MRPAPAPVVALVERFARERHALDERELRARYIDPLFSALGWDVANEQRRDVVHEAETRRPGAPAYGFYIGRPGDTTRQFFVETRRPGGSSAFQLRRCAWSADLAVSILTDFESLAVYDTRVPPKQTDDAHTARLRCWRHEQFVEQWHEIASLLARDAVADGSLLALGQTAPGSIRVDDAFLALLEAWRALLAQDIATHNDLPASDLDTTVQRLLDRILFLRICEDRGIEAPGRLAHAAAQENIHAALESLFREARDRYDADLFQAPERSKSKFLKIGDGVLRRVLAGLYFPSPYVFDYISADILGSVHERLLGKVITVDARRQVAIEQRHEHRRNTGVYYTPSYVVDFMVRHTIGRILAEETPRRAATLRILDPACGSGTFLIGAYQFLLDWHLDHYVDNDPTEPAEQGRIIKTRSGEWRLTTSERKRILINSIFGADIDRQAVEITKLALLLKVLEGSADERVLPDLGRNIQRGNFLIGDDWFTAHPDATAEEIDRVCPFEPAADGFDIILGNPPFLKEFTHRQPFDDLKGTAARKYYQGKMDYWYLFACRSLDLLRPGGLHSFIGPNNWGTQAGASVLRKKLFAETRLHLFFDFGPFMVFRDASIQTAIYLAEKTGKPHTGSTRALRVADAGTPLPALFRALQTLSPSQQVECFDAEVDSQGGVFTFVEDEDDEILARIAERAPWRLGKHDIGQGIVAPQEFVLKSHLPGLRAGVAAGAGIFVLTDAERLALKLGKAEAALLRPFYTSEQAHPFRVAPEHDYWVIYIDSRLAREPHRYPRLKTHLDRFAPVLTSAFKPYGLHRARDPQLFEAPKILALRKTAAPVFSYSDFPCYVSQTFNVIQTDGVDLPGLTALLNSSVIHYWLKKRGKLQGTRLQVDAEPLMALPLFAAVPQAIAGFTDKLAALHRAVRGARGPAAREAAERAYSAARHALDRQVYALYGLGAADIARIEAVLAE